LIVTLQPVGPFCVAVPPGHSAESNTPPLLLLTLNVNSWLGHLQRPPVQNPVRQSVAAEHIWFTTQSGQEGPPQSTSVSLPFFMPSVQVGFWQMLPTQTPLWQSEPKLQSPPFGQPVQPPPQSTPVSLPFSMPSEQVGA
jgi:hypothetical protein